MAQGIVFELFRLELADTRQLDLEQEPLSVQFTRDFALRDVLTEGPAGEGRYGLWTLANVEQVSDFGYYFRIGRIVREAVNSYHDGNFVDVPFDRAPYTHAFLDVHHQVLAVARNPEVAAHTRIIARRFAELAKSSRAFRRAGFDCEADQVFDPIRVVEAIQRSSRVTRMWLTFKRPNHFDEEEDFRAPVKRTLEHLSAKSGTVDFSGDLDRERAERLTRATVAAGDKVTARLVDDDTGHVRSVSTADTPATVFALTVGDVEIKAQIHERVQEKFRSLRRVLSGFGIGSGNEGQDE